MKYAQNKTVGVLEKHGKLILVLAKVCRTGKIGKARENFLKWIGVASALSKKERPCFLSTFDANKC